MQSNRGRVVLLLAAVAAVVVLFFVLRDDEAGDEVVQGTSTPASQQQPEAAVFEIEVIGTAPVGGVEDLEVEKGEKVEIVVSTPDTTDHIHLHGYDLTADLAPGRPAKIGLEADIEGIFEVELEEAVAQIAELTVNP